MLERSPRRRARARRERDTGAARARPSFACVVAQIDYQAGDFDAAAGRVSKPSLEHGAGRAGSRAARARGQQSRRHRGDARRFQRSRDAASTRRSSLLRREHAPDALGRGAQRTRQRRRILKDRYDACAARFRRSARRVRERRRPARARRARFEPRRDGHASLPLCRSRARVPARRRPVRDVRRQRGRAERADGCRRARTSRCSNPTRRSRLEPRLRRAHRQSGRSAAQARRRSDARRSARSRSDGYAEAAELRSTRPRPQPSSAGRSRVDRRARTCCPAHLARASIPMRARGGTRRRSR